MFYDRISVKFHFRLQEIINSIIKIIRTMFINKHNPSVISICILMLLCISPGSYGRHKLTDASDLTVTGKIFKTANPYHRIDTTCFHGFTPTENYQLRCPSGLAVLFKTNSSFISIIPEYGEIRHSLVTSDLAHMGFDLYIRDDGKWIFAGSGVSNDINKGMEIKLIQDMDGKAKECMLHLPIYSELKSLKIVTESGKEILPLEAPFRHRILIYGSSYTQGACISRPGMSYPMQFIRNTGIQLLSLGCGGNGKMQPQFAEAIKSAENIDAMIFDCFSNPNAEMIEERTIPFIRKIRESHPDIPLIFVSTVYRENRNFSLKNEAYEKAKEETAEKVMTQAVKEFEDVYFVNPESLTGKSHDTSVDGVHPSDMGYTIWSKTIEKPILKILRKYKIR